MKQTLEQAAALDSYIDRLAKDPNTAPPLNLDRQSATLVRALAELEQGISTGPVEEVKERTWQKVLGTAQTELDAPGELLYLNRVMRRKPRLAMVGLGLVASLAIAVLVISVVLAVFSNNPEPISQGYVTAIPRATPNLTPLPTIAASASRTTAFDSEVMQVAYSPDGKYLAVVTSRKLYLQDRNGQTVKTLSKSDNNSHFVISSKDGQTPPAQLESKPDDSSIVKIAWAPDSQSLAILNGVGTGKSTAVRLWRINEPTDRDFVEAPSPVTDIGWKPDGQRLLTLSQDKGLRFWDLSGQMIVNRLTGDGLMALSPDEKTVGVSSTNGGFNYYEAGALETGQKDALNFGMGGSYKPGFAIKGLAWANDSQTLVIVYNSSLLFMNKIGTFTKQVSFTAGNITSLNWSPDDRYLAIGTDNNQLNLWQVNGENVQAFAPLTRHVAPINSVSWSPDGKSLATGSDDHSVVEWTVPEQG